MILTLASLLAAATPGQVQVVLPNPSEVIPAMKRSMDLTAPVVDMRQLDRAGQLFKPLGIKLLEPQTWKAAGLNDTAPAYLFVDRITILALKVDNQKLLQEKLQKAGANAQLIKTPNKKAKLAALLGKPGQPELGLLVQGDYLWIQTLPRRLLPTPVKEREPAARKLAATLSRLATSAPRAKKPPKVDAVKIGPEAWFIAKDARGRVGFSDSGVEVSCQVELRQEAEAAVGGSRLGSGPAPSANAVAWVRGVADLKSSRRTKGLGQGGLNGDYHLEFLDSGVLFASLGLNKGAQAKELRQALAAEGWVTKIVGRRLEVFSEIPPKASAKKKSPWTKLKARRDAGFELGTLGGSAVVDALRRRGQSKVGPKLDPAMLTLVSLVAGPSLKNVRAITASAKSVKKQLSVKARVEFVPLAAP